MVNFMAKIKIQKTSGGGNDNPHLEPWAALSVPQISVARTKSDDCASWCAAGVHTVSF